MINENVINSTPVNYTNADISTTEDQEIVSSFFSSQITKYAIKTPYGQYFNIGSFGAYSGGKCGVGEQIRYGNIRRDTDIENLATKEINSGVNPILDGGYIQNSRYSEKEISFTLEIKSKDMKSLEKEMRDIKRNLDYKGCKIIKKEKTRISEINVELQSIEFGEISVKNTEVTLNFISLDPHFKKPSGNTKAYRNISGNLDVSLIINDTDHNPFINTLLDLKQVSGTITGIKLELDGYEVEIACNISAPEKVIFNGQKSEIFVGNTEIEDFIGKFRPFSINTPNTAKVTFMGGTADLYSIYFTYDNIYK